jgi:pimeloyl-ACP methyl ester carboxylesterase
MNYVVQGEGDPLVLIGGYASGYWQSWQRYLPALSERYRVLAFDSRGSGETDAPDAPYSVAMMSADTLGLMDHVGIERAHFLGRSLGGCIAQAVVLARPERVRSLVMTSTFARIGQRGRTLVGHWIDAVRTLGFEKFFEYLMTYFYTAGFYDSHYDQVRASVQGLLGAKRTVHGFAHTGAAVMGHDVLEQLASIRIPTLLLCGGEDLITPAAHTEEMGRLIPGARVNIVPNTAHGFLTERPESFRVITDFIQNH